MNTTLTLEKYKRAISGNQTSYKFALGLALIETVNNSNRIFFKEIAEKVAQYYFKNHFVYKINESNNPSQTPIVISILEEYINNVYGEGAAVKKLNNVDLKNLAQYLITPKEMSKIVRNRSLSKKLDTKKGFFSCTLPCWQHAKLTEEKKYYNYITCGKNDFFQFNSDNQIIEISDGFLDLLSERRELITDITITEWVKFAEKFNVIPRLYHKISLTKPKRTTNKFEPLFDKVDMLHGEICFLCNKPITDKDIKSNRSLDHVIPFSYIFSCDLWNLVRAHRTCNSSKNDRLGSPEMIKKLISRNVELWNYERNIPDQFKDMYYNYFKNHFISEDDIRNKINKLVLDCRSVGFEQLEDKEIPYTGEYLREEPQPFTYDNVIYENSIPPHH